MPESEELFKLVANAAPVLVWMSDTRQTLHVLQSALAGLYRKIARIRAGEWMGGRSPPGGFAAMPECLRTGVRPERRIQDGVPVATSRRRVPLGVRYRSSEIQERWFFRGIHRIVCGHNGSDGRQPRWCERARNGFDWQRGREWRLPMSGTLPPM